MPKKNNTSAKSESTFASIKEAWNKWGEKVVGGVVGALVLLIVGVLAGALPAAITLCVMIDIVALHKMVRAIEAGYWKEAMYYAVPSFVLTIVLVKLYFVVAGATAMAAGLAVAKK